MLTIEIARERVAKGAEWLDGRWPGWHKVINLGTLTLDDCSLCVMGQIWTGCVPQEEKSQLIGQIIEGMEGAGLHYSEEQRQRTFRALLNEEGYWVFSKVKMPDWVPVDLGFYVNRCQCADDDEGACVGQAYTILTDAWTELIIQRRLDEHPAVILDFSKIREVPRELVAA